MSDELNVSLPKPIVWNIKASLPLTRNNYKKYHKAKIDWNIIFLEIDEEKNKGNNNNYMKDISSKYGINRKTLRNKYSDWVLKNRPIIVDKELRGGYNKLLTLKQERNLYTYVKEVFLDNNMFFDDECLGILATKTYNTFNADDKIDQISDGWIYYYKLRWKLSTQRAKYSRIAKTMDDISLKKFYDSCLIAISTIDIKFIFNMDETFWRIVNGNINVIGIVGAENRKLLTEIDPKTGFTTVFIASADGKLLKPIIILKGKTDVCFEKTGLNDNSLLIRKLSPNGWISIDIMLHILNIIGNITKNTRSVLILDEYSVHEAEEIKIEAVRLNINLIYVPPGRTGTNQPLDVGVNGPIKCIGKRINKEIYLGNPFEKHNINTSIKSLIEAKDKIREDIIIKAFQIACGYNDKLYVENREKFKLDVIEKNATIHIEEEKNKTLNELINEETNTVINIEQEDEALNELINEQKNEHILKITEIKEELENMEENIKKIKEEMKHKKKELKYHDKMIKKL